MEKKIIFFIVASVAFAYLGLTFSTFSLQSQQLETCSFNGKQELQESQS